MLYMVGEGAAASSSAKVTAKLRSQYGPALLESPHPHPHVSGPTLAQTWRLVTVSRRASSEREATGTTKGLSGMCSSLNLMETS